MKGIDILDGRTLPAIEGMEEIIREHMPWYLFYSGRGNKRTGWCTACGEKMPDHPTGLPFGNYPDFWRGDHNNRVSCPKCDRNVKLKCMGRYRSCRSLDGHMRLMIPQRIHHDRVLLRCFYIEYTYHNIKTPASLWWHEDARYDLQPGSARMTWCNPNTDAWEERKKPTEPWPMFRWFVKMYIDYQMSGYTEFEDTFLYHFPFERVSGWDWPARYTGYEYSRTPWGKLLSLYCMYPNMEMAIKENMRTIVGDFVCRGKKNNSILDWKQAERAKFLRVTKPEARLICEQGGDARNIRYMMQKYDLDVKEAILWEQKGFGGFSVDKESEKTLTRYLIKQGFASNGRRVYFDYLRWCEELGRDTDVPSIRWPKKLAEAHDLMYEAHQALLAEKRAREEAAAAAGYQKVREWYRKIFAYEDGNYIMRIPEKLEEIAEEGKAQHHCVAGYIQRHAVAKTVIVFMRSASEPDKPLYTIEVSPEGKLIQAQGYHNDADKRPAGEAREFIDNWLLLVKKRLKKDRQEEKKVEDAAS